MSGTTRQGQPLPTTSTPVSQRVSTRSISSADRLSRSSQSLSRAVRPQSGSGRNPLLALRRAETEKTRNNILNFNTRTHLKVQSLVSITDEQNILLRQIIDELKGGGSLIGGGLLAGALGGMTALPRAGAATPRSAIPQTGPRAAGSIASPATVPRPASPATVPRPASPATVRVQPTVTPPPRVVAPPSPPAGQYRDQRGRFARAPVAAPPTVQPMPSPQVQPRLGASMVSSPSMPVRIPPLVSAPATVAPPAASRTYTDAAGRLRDSRGRFATAPLTPPTLAPVAAPVIPPRPAAPITPVRMSPTVTSPPRVAPPPSALAPVAAPVIPPRPAAPITIAQPVVPPLSSEPRGRQIPEIRPSATPAQRTAIKQRLVPFVRDRIAQQITTRIPAAGILATVFFGGQRAISGDYVGAGLVFASGMLASVPGVGTLISLGLSSTLMAHDLNRQFIAEGMELTDEERTQIVEEIVQDILSERPARPPVPEYNERTRQQLEELVRTEDPDLIRFLGADTFTDLNSLLRLPSRGDGAQARQTRQTMAARLIRIQSRLLDRPNQVPVPPEPSTGSQLIQQGTESVVADQARSSGGQTIQIQTPPEDANVQVNNRMIGQMAPGRREISLNRRLESQVA